MEPVGKTAQQPMYSAELVRFLHGLSADALPEAVLDRARYFLLDYLGVTLRGSLEDSARSVQRAVASMGAPGPAQVLGTPISTIPTLAALANGTAAHSIEQDDTHSGGSIHLGATMYSVALALASPATPANEFLAATVAGFEAAARISVAATAAGQYALGFHPTGTCGAFGAAITASKLLGLSFEQTTNAFGIAGSMASGSMEFLAEGAWTKRVHPGLAAQAGIQAAMLAREGFVGPQRILEGRDGYLAGHSRNADAARLTRGLGESFEILRTAVKPHTCCRYMQGPIDAVLDIVRTEDLKPEQIHSIEVAALEAGWGIVCEPASRKYHPESVVDAQFSMPFGVAVAAVRRSAGLNDFTLDQIRSAAIQAMMPKVRMVRDAEIERTFPAEWPARVVIETVDARRLERFVRHPKGDPENPLSWDEMGEKFLRLAKAVLPIDQCSELLSGVRGDDLSGLGLRAGLFVDAQLA